MPDAQSSGYLGHARIDWLPIAANPLADLGQNVRPLGGGLGERTIVLGREFDLAKCSAKPTASRCVDRRWAAGRGANVRIDSHVRFLPRRLGSFAVRLSSHKKLQPGG